MQNLIYTINLFIGRTPTAPLKGNPGNPGLNGSPGLPGIDGRKGEAGLPGTCYPHFSIVNEKSSYRPTKYAIVITLVLFNVLIVITFKVNMLYSTGGQGLPGIDGLPGQKGENGQPGPRGSPGPRGLTGPRGDKGVGGLPGRAGDDGRPGIDGRPGEPGRQGKADIIMCPSNYIKKVNII